MSYTYTEKQNSKHRKPQSNECIYCPMKKPVFWPLLLLLFLFSPFIFSSENSKISPAGQIKNPPHAVSQSVPQAVLDRNPLPSRDQVQGQTSQNTKVVI